MSTQEPIKTFLILCILSFVPKHTAQAQFIPDERQVDWNIAGKENRSLAGISEVRPLDVHTEFNFVREFGGDNTGKKDNADLLIKALEQTPSPATIHFPSGIYLFKKSIPVPSGKLIKGTSPNTTIFLFDLLDADENLFVVQGNGSVKYTKVKNPYHKGANKVEVKNGNTFAPGDDVELIQENDPKIYFYQTYDKPWAAWSVGQMLKVSRVEGNTVHFDRTLTLDYNSKLEIRLLKVEMVKEVGFKGFTVERLDKGRGANFFFKHAANCWISCVKSTMATREHVRINNSRNCEVKGSYFYDARFHCGGGSGYGILLNDHPTECRIYNNIFIKLRHSLIVKEGANRNVISYNFSDEVKISDGSIAEGGCRNARIAKRFPDISVHGHYSYMNLFEHNVVRAIHSADNWGSTGPGTTFFRNKVATDYGIRISMASEKQNVVGNVVNGVITEDEEVINTVKLKNRELLRIDTLSSLILPPSLYLTGKPDFYGNQPWPSIDPLFPLSKSTNPAKGRWEKGVVFDKYCCGDIPAMNSYVMHRDDFVIFYEAGSLYIEHVMDKNYEFWLFDLQGKMLRKIPDFSTNQFVNLGFYLPEGLYILKLLNKEESHQYKLMVKR